MLTTMHDVVSDVMYGINAVHAIHDLQVMYDPVSDVTYGINVVHAIHDLRVMYDIPVTII